MAKSDYGRDMYRQLTEVMARLERVEEKSRESEKKHETEIRDLKATQKEEIRRIREEHRKEKKRWLWCYTARAYSHWTES